MTKSERLRRAMVDTLVERGNITSDLVREAFLAIPRERFLGPLAKERGLEAVYNAVEAIPTRFDPIGRSVSSSSAPVIMAVMLEQLGLEPGHRILEVGAGTGYNAALLKHIVGRRGRVTAVDIDRSIVAQARRNLRDVNSTVRVVTGDGRKGVPADVPYDRIIATVSSSYVPRAWFRQVRPGGTIALPLQLSAGQSWPQVCVALRKDRGALTSTATAYGGFMGLRDQATSPATFVRYIEVIERGGGEPDQTLALLTGDVLKRYTPEQKRRLLGLAFSEERSQRVKLGGYPPGFQSYMTLAARPDEVIAGGWGLVDRAVRSFAYLHVRTGTPATVRSSGGDAAERRMLRHISDWTARGCPGIDRLRLTITFRRQAPRAWRSSPRTEGVIGFDWEKGRP